MATTPIPAKRGRKPAAATAQQAGGQVQSLTRGLKLLEWIAESHSSVALTELAQQAGRTGREMGALDELGRLLGLAQLHDSPSADHHATAGLRPPGWRAGSLGRRGACFRGRQQLSTKPQSAGHCPPDPAPADGRFR